ncbi:MAG: HAD family hydrolase [Chloroflexi bacterium]|nr:HAD family hydrolase [Chloroflexota bacterium]
MPNQPDIKLVAIDVDGTIMTSKNKLTDKTADAVKRAHEQGVHIVIATGKTRNSADVIYKKVGFTTPGIFVQGLVITYPDGTEKHLGTLDVDLLRRVITFVEDRGLQAIGYSGKRILARRMTTEARVLTEHYDEPLPEVVGPLQNLLDTTPINKVMFCGGSVEQITHLRWQLGHMIGGSARLTQAIPEAVELLPTGASKGTALKLLLKEMKIEPAHVMAIGDGENDIEMIQLVGHGLAMGNGNAKLKAAAKAVLPSNDEDGVAEALLTHVLKKDEPKASTTAPKKKGSDS